MMEPIPNGRKRWTGLPKGATSSQREECNETPAESSPASFFNAKNEEVPDTTHESKGNMYPKFAKLQTRRLEAMERQQEEIERRRGRDQTIEEKFKEVSLSNNDEADENRGRRCCRSPSPFHGVLELGRRSSMASSTFLEDSSRHRPEFRDPEIDERETDSDYEMLMYSDIWSDANDAARLRTQGSRFPRPFQNIRTEIQEDIRPTPLAFDDFHTHHVSSDPSSPESQASEGWDGWFLSDTPHETYRFEREFPNAAPLLRKIYALPHNRKVELMAAAAVVGWKQLAAGLDKAIRTGRLVVDGVTLNARDLKEIAEERVLDWAPGLFEAICNLATGPLMHGA